MKLAEALQERADLNRRIAQLRQRLDNNATVQEGEKPAENPAELLRELDGCISRLEELIAAINHTNCATEVEGKSLTQLIARRDALTLKIQAYRQFLSSASYISQRAMRSEIKILGTVDVPELQAGVDRLSKELRELDNKIQQTNWTVDLT